MSTFQGKLKEITGISVDRFDGKNLDSSVFFLSHCHTDHMRGLQCQSFQEKLIREKKYLYLSSMSAVILRRLIPRIANQIKELPLEKVTYIAMDNRDLSVTCIPAGHCPGSVMFLFEIDEVCVLYTGDYRIHTSDITKFKCFYDGFGKLKRVDKIYLDTTFFMESYFVLPKREESLLELCRIILSWISEDPENCIKLDVRARYGYEYVFKEIYSTCKMPVHIDDEKYKFYSLIPELDQCVTTDGSVTQIHNCHYEQKAACEFCDKSKLRIIKLSAFRWEHDDFSKGVSEMDEDGIFYVCYSTHASYQEGLALLNFLRPKEVHICVERPDDPVTDTHIKKLVEKHVKEINPDIETSNVPNKLFKTSQNLDDIMNRAEERSNNISPGTPPQKIFKKSDPSILDSPPR